MEDEKIIIVTTRELLHKTLREAMMDNNKNKPGSEFEKDKMNLTQAAKFTGMSIPSFNKRIKDGIFTKHGTGRKIFFLKSELIEALKSNF